MSEPDWERLQEWSRFEAGERLAAEARGEDPYHLRQPGASLDLGIVRDPLLGATNDFHFFTEEFVGLGLQPPPAIRRRRRWFRGLRRPRL